MIEVVSTIHPVVTLRPAQAQDVKEIVALFAAEVQAGRMLLRTPEEIHAQLGLWRVAVWQEQVVGCISLVFFNLELCEVRSLAVLPTYQGNGLGARLVESAVELAREKQAQRVLTLTRAARLFEKMGFQYEQVFNFPEKVWRDCKPCPLLHHCDEVALVYHIHKEEV